MYMLSISTFLYIFTFKALKQNYMDMLSTLADYYFYKSTDWLLEP